MDGTGRLFSPLISALSGHVCDVISFPQSGTQDYQSLTAYVKDRLPNEDYILLAESFSGPIGAALARSGDKNMKGVIFVATFLSSPNRALLAVARFLPIKFLSGFPFSKFLYKLLFLGPGASDEVLDLFQSTVRGLSAQVIRERLRAMQSLKFSGEKINLPVAYIQAVSDKLVPAEKALEFKRFFNNVMVKSIEGPHFILQANPGACAEIVSEFLTET